MQDVHLDSDNSMWWSYKILIHNHSQDTVVLQEVPQNPTVVWVTDKGDIVQ